MPDHAISTSPAVQAQLDRLFAHGPGTDTLGLDRITRLLARLGDPHRALPPVFHVAGTNGKGSTCAFLRAALEAAGYRVHAYTSPHLVRFNERIRIAGMLIDDDALAPLLAEVLDQADDLNASFFEVTTAAAFLAFARIPADACVVEVGLGGRLDATNVLPAPAVCGIAALGIDHEAFLLAPEAGVPIDPAARIAFEKAGIASRGVPLVTLAYPPAAAEAVRAVAAARGAPLLIRGKAWEVTETEGGLRFRDGKDELVLPRPALAGPHQPDNAALAVAMLRSQGALPVGPDALAQGLRSARWPARMQRLGDGALVRRLPPAQRRRGAWLDGAHNPSAAAAIAGSWADNAPTALIVGLLANKDAAGVLRALVTPGMRVVAVPVPGHTHHAPAALAALAADLGALAATSGDVAAALDWLAKTPIESVLIAGSLYLAGDVLRLNDELPD
ncbi:bifunctional folylpolyglutamate synthase/dihydrofolate synthase [Sphingomonas sp.]|uniref:bifunctional folylpolyglutamate synthase/dihydrofolate synthase n=1 Tax=Sphingomonas sp. TaxID=28214 RepID=UPI003CC6AD54